MTWTSAGVQSGTDTTLSGLTAVTGTTAPSGGNLYATTTALTVNGSLSVPTETLQAPRIEVTSTGSLTIGADDGAFVSGGALYLQSPTTAFATGSPLRATGGAVVTLSNCNIVVASGGGGAEIGGYGQSWVLNAKNVNFAKRGTTKGWHYIGGGGVLENVSWRNCECVFFSASPASASGLSVTASNWGFGIDGTNINFKLVGSRAPRAMIQDTGNTFILLDCRIQDWVACRQGAAVNSSFRFSRRISLAAVGAEAPSVTAHLIAADGALFATFNGNASGIAAVQELQWGQVTTSRLGANSNPAVTANKLLATDINNNTGIGHDSGAYKLPLTAVFSKYAAAWQANSGITFDVTSDAILAPLVLAPNVATDSNVTLSETAAGELTSINTLDNLYDRAKWHKTRPIQANMEYPTISTQPVNANGTELDLGSRNLVVDATAAAAFAVDTGTHTITIKSSVLSAGTKFKSLKTTGTVSFANGATLTAALEDANNAGQISIVGVLNADTVEFRKASDNALIASRTGPGSFAIAPANVGVSAYFVRLSGSNTVMSTITAPVTLTTGVNPDVPLYAGAEVQVAQAARIEQLPTLAQIEASTLAKDATVTAAQAAIVTEINANEAKIDTLQTAVAAIPTNPVLDVDYTRQSLGELVLNLQNLNYSNWDGSTASAQRSSLLGYLSIPQRYSQESINIAVDYVDINGSLIGTINQAKPVQDRAVFVNQNFASMMFVSQVRVSVNGDVIGFATVQLSNSSLSALTRWRIEASTVLAKEATLNTRASQASVTALQTSIPASVWDASERTLNGPLFK